MLAHKVHIAVAEGKDRIVTAVATSSGAIQEHTQVPELLTKHWMVTGEKPHEVVADAGYGITSTYEFLTRSDITPNIHVQARTRCEKREEAAGRLQVRHEGLTVTGKEVVGHDGLEPSTCRLRVGCSTD